MPPKFILVYPAGTSKVDAAGAPSFMLVRFMVVPSKLITLIGTYSFWSTQVVLVRRFQSVDTHLSHIRPFTLSVPSFLQVTSLCLPQGFCASNELSILGIFRVMGLGWLPCISIYIR